jgi:hypothetical protein
MSGVSTFAHVIAVIAGAALALATVLSAIKAFVVPRPLSPLISRVVFVITRRMFLLAAPKKMGFAQRDRVLARQSPFALLLLPLVWLAMMVGAFTAIQWGLGSTLRDSFLIAGSSMFTLGVKFADNLPSAAASFAQAAVGLLLTALVISYLPSIYGAYSRREMLVGMLEHRAGTPPSPYELLVRYNRVGLLSEIADDLFRRWEEWFVEIEESHTSIASLVFFRSPYPSRSWVTAAGCVLDTAALTWSIVDQPRSGRTAIVLRSGFMSLRRIADYFRIPYIENPTADDPISVTREEFDLMCIELEAEDIALRSDRDAAWRDYCGWRVNYDAVLVGLAKLVDAPEGRWSSDRVGPAYAPRIVRRKR